MKSTHVHFHSIFLNVHSKKKTNPSADAWNRKINVECPRLLQKVKVSAAENSKCLYNFDLTNKFSKILYGKKNYTNYKNIITAVLIYFNSLSSILISQDAPYQQYRAISWKEDTTIGVGITSVYDKWNTVVVWMSNKLESSKPAVKSRRPRRHGNQCRGYDRQM